MWISPPNARIGLMKIGIIGTGNMGRTLGGLWAAAGHEVFFGGRRPEAAGEAAVLARAHATAEVRNGTNHEAASFGDVLLYCVRGIDPADAIGDRDVLNGKPLIDLNNRAIPSGFQFEVSPSSLAETLQTQAPNAKVAKAFNMLPQEVFEIERAELQDKHVSVLIATDHQDARIAVEILAHDLGLNPVNAGPLRNARLLESAADLVRYLIARTGPGPLAILSVPLLTSATGSSRFGGRRPSELDGPEPQRIFSVGQHLRVESSGQIDAPVDVLWSFVSNFNNIAHWHPDVIASRLESGTGTDAGSVRNLRLRNGMCIRERLLAISPENHYYKYSVIESPLPMRDHESLVRFTRLNGSRTRVTWIAEFSATGGDAEALANGVKTGVMDLGIEGLTAAATSGRKEV